MQRVFPANISMHIIPKIWVFDQIGLIWVHRSWQETLFRCFRVENCHDRPCRKNFRMTKNVRTLPKVPSGVKYWEFVFHIQNSLFVTRQITSQKSHHRFYECCAWRKRCSPPRYASKTDNNQVLSKGVIDVWTVCTACYVFCKRAGCLGKRLIEQLLPQAVFTRAGASKDFQKKINSN